MSEVKTEAATPTEFSVELWAAFWAAPDPSRVGLLSTDDVVGDWPGDLAPVRGKEAYRDRIAKVLERVPDLHLEVAEHAESDECIFIHWVGRGTGAKGPFEIDGIDRILLEDGRVKENVIRYDPGKFDELVGDGGGQSQCPD
jgi:hypothetical protein